MIKTLSLVFTSDEHGHLRGAPAIQRAVQDARAQNPTLLLSEGDVFEGSAVSALLGLEPARELLETAGYDAIALGNHDFDRGRQIAEQWVRESPCPVLAANIRDTKTGEAFPGTRPHLVFDLGGVRVGLVGVTTQETAVTCPAGATEGLEFTDPHAAVQSSVKEMDADLKGVMSHLGLAADRELAQKSSGVTFILGGHSHDSTFEVVNGVLIAHPGCFRNGAGRLDLQFDTEKRQVVGYDYKPIPIPADTPPDGPVAALVQGYLDRMKAPLAETLAHLESRIDHDPNQLNDAAEHLITRAMVQGSGAQFAFINQKYMRAPLEAGPLTRGQLLDAMPFDNRVQTVTMTAGELLGVMQDSLARNDQSSVTLCGGGNLKVVGDLESHGLALMDEKDRALPAETPVTVATTDYLMSGGLGYLKTDLRGRAADFGLVRDAVEKLLRSF